MDSIKYVTLPLKGRAVIASKKIKDGDVILKESPLVSAQFLWNKEFKYLCCDHCMKPLETAEENVQRLLGGHQAVVLPFSIEELVDKSQIVKCNTCEVLYCSIDCAEKAKSTYHSFECGQYKIGGRFREIQELWKKSHYPPETATISLIIRIFGMIKNNCQHIHELLDAFCKSSKTEDLQKCHKMLGEKFSSQLSQLQEAIHSLFGNDEQLAKFASYDGFISLLALIGTNSQGIGTSSFANWVEKVSNLDLDETKRQEADEFIDAIYGQFNDTVGEFLDNEGSGLYVDQSKFNHSCIPNAQIIFPSSNFSLHVVALQDIEPEDEICISYIDECFLSRSRHSRQKYLYENYLFKCECQKCMDQSDDPDITSDEDDEMETDD